MLKILLAADEYDVGWERSNHHRLEQKRYRSELIAESCVGRAGANSAVREVLTAVKHRIKSAKILSDSVSAQVPVPVSVSVTVTPLTT